MRMIAMLVALAGCGGYGDGMPFNMPAPDASPPGFLQPDESLISPLELLPSGQRGYTITWRCLDGSCEGTRKTTIDLSSGRCGATQSSGRDGIYVYRFDVISGGPCAVYVLGPNAWIDVTGSLGAGPLQEPARWYSVVGRNGRYFTFQWSPYQVGGVLARAEVHRTE